MFIRWYKKYEHRLSVLAFLTGFTIDNFTLTRIDLLFDNLILATYLVFAALGIFLLQFLLRKKIERKIIKNIALVLPFFIQFAFGGLFSGYFVFYSRSASFVTSWLFIILIIMLMIGNEFFKRQYARLEFQISIFFITLFSFSIFYIPILVHKIGAWIFVLSGLTSLIIIAVFIKLLALVIPQKIKRSQSQLRTSILTIFVIFNILYFTNIIPPIPLSLKEGSVHHYVERIGENYRARSETIKWYEIHKRISPRIHLREDDPVYVFTSVFAPTDLTTKVFHSWQYFDETLGEWVETDRLAYSIFGGRDGGYRGYSQKTNVIPGKWRVDIVTERNQIIGRERFDIKRVDTRPDNIIAEDL